MDASPLDPGPTDLETHDIEAADLAPTEPLPQPPAEYDPAEQGPSRRQRPGELTTGWRVVFTVGWAGVILGFAAVWKSSRTLGLPLWWLGPEADPKPLVIQVLPFVLPGLLIAAAVRSVRRLPWMGLAVAAITFGIAVPDVSRFTGLATVEIVLAAAGALVSVASFAGVLRRPD